MKTKTILTWTLGIVMVLATLVSALASTSPAPTHEYNFNDDLTDIGVGTKMNVALGSACTFNADTPFTDGGKSISCDGSGANSFIDLNITDFNGTFAATISMWLKCSSVAGNDRIYSNDGAAAHRFSLSEQVGSRFRFDWTAGIGSVIYGDNNDWVNATTNTWKLVSTTIGADPFGGNDTMKIYINESIVQAAELTGTASGGNRIVDSLWLLNDPSTTTQAPVCKVDGVRIWNSTNLSKVQISELLLNETGLVAPAAPGTATLNLSSPRPLNNTQFNTQPIVINTTVNSSTTFNCTLFINDTTNITRNHNFSSGTNVYVEFNASGFQSGRVYNYTMSCNNTNANDNSTANTFFFDITNPTITTDFKNNLTFALDNFTYQFNFSDNFMIHSYNISLDDVQINGSFDLNTTSVSYTLNRDPKTLALGLHNLTIRVADGHTSNEINDYKWKNGLFNNYLEYSFGRNDIRIRAKDDSWFDSWDTEKQKDRYIFEFEPSNPSSTQVFVVEADNIIRIAKKGDYYKGQWLIINNQWLDFVNLAEPNSKVSIKRITDTKVEVTVYGLKNPERQVYSSIGDLNVVTETFTFSITNVTVSFELVEGEFEDTEHILRINTTTNIINTDAALFYNHTWYSPTKTIVVGYDQFSVTLNTGNISATSIRKPFNWSYAIQGVANNLSGNLTGFNQTIFSIGVDNCTTFGAIGSRAINFTIRRDDNDSQMPGKIDGYFKTWISDEEAFVPFNLTWRGNSPTGYGVCIFPNSSNYSVFAQLEYEEDPDHVSFSKKTYYLSNATLDNLTDEITLWLTPNTTLVTFTVTDEDDNPVPGVKIDVLDYDLPTDSFKTSEILISDSDGEALGNIVLNTEWYKFMLSLQGVTVLETDPVKITSTSRNFRINLFDDFFLSYNKAGAIIHSLSYTNATKVFDYTFSDPTGIAREGCLKVVERNIYGESVFNETCVTSASSTILVTLPADVEGKTYFATGTININPDFITDHFTVSFDFDHRRWGPDGIFMTFLLRLTIAMIGIWSPAVAIIGILIIDIAMIFMGLYQISAGFLVIYALLIIFTVYKLNRK